MSSNYIPETLPFKINLGVFDGLKKNKTNYIQTTKYTLINFLPFCLYLQFRRFANFYFLIVAIVQSIPIVSPLAPISAIAPLIFVVSLSMIREAFEDFMRYKNDLQTNSQKSLCYRENQWTEIEWKNIIEGDIVKIIDLEFFPADIVLLGSSNPNGIAYIMTSSLDGEKNLKSKFSLKETQNIVNDNTIENFINCELEFAEPNENLFYYQGILSIRGDKKNLSAKQLLLRGAMLKNTQWIIGVVSYVGHDTKLVLNSGKPAFKSSNIEKIMNYILYMLVIFQIIICLIAMILSITWYSKNQEKYSQFINTKYGALGQGVLTLFSLFVLLNIIIPISLIISLEMVKMTQVYFINVDNDMYSLEQNRGATAFSSSLNEELGQIQYIFTDKTGTLTSNELVFKYAQIGGVFIGESTFIKNFNIKKSMRTFNDLEKIEIPTTPIMSFKELLSDRGIDHLENDFDFINYETKKLYSMKNSKELGDNFLLLLSICHDCLADKSKDNPDILEYHGMSPDEVVLVETARDCSYEYLSSSNNSKFVKINNVVKEIEILEYFEFDSDRKRSSIIVRHEGLIKFFIKGADSIIIDRLDKHIEHRHLLNTKEVLEAFSNEGLRTLCYAMKILSENEYKTIRDTIDSYGNYFDKSERIAKYASEIEVSFKLIGCTAVEDKLQKNVPQVIADFITANIKVWMLTGDKLETAENIAYSCKMIQKDFDKLYLTVNDSLEQKYFEYKREINDNKHNKKISLIVEGPVLLKFNEDKALGAKYVVDIFSKCDSVICCRMSPNGKGDVISLVKDNLKTITLAIGDGANDVNMIKRAHIGIGIYGKEGLRAVQASDYAIPEFKALWKLLFVHGRWSYIRIGEMILYFFYKNMIFAVPQFLFFLHNAYSSQTIYDDYYITFFNMFFTSMPLMMRAVFDQDIYYKKWTSKLNNKVFSSKTLVENKLLKKFYPYLYYIGQENIIFK